MLNNIFKKYKNNKSDKDDFLNEDENLLNKTKTDNIINKYCTLYDNNVKPLTTEHLIKKERKLNNSNTTGKEWFDMKVPEMTPELKEDLKAIQLRDVIDPARFYKKMDRNQIPKFFQVGTIMDNILDGKKNRLKKEEVKSRIVEEFLESDTKKNYTLRKFDELQNQRRKIGLNKMKLNKYKLNNRKKSRKSEFVIK
jgi:hypothetical protein